jgi:DNA primase
VVSLHQAGVENVVASGGTSLTPDQLRLIKKFTNNLTILYDGDSAGVKAALRGLDLAIEEGLNVQVVLIPDNEDPDSYVRKTGAEQFRSFIQKNKKDFILFQVETSLKNAGNDVQKKSEVVNRIAETIARLTRPEDFIRRQHYITQVSQLLSIDEAGLINLINKHTRDKLSKEAAKQSGLRQDYHSNLEEQLAIEEDVSQRPFKTNDAINEEAVIRALIEFGPLEIHETTVAEYIFTVLDYNEIEIENAEINRLYTLYRSMYAEGKIPGREDFIYHEDRTISETVCKLLEIQYDLSPKWQEMQPEKIPTREDLFAMEVESAITYLLLRKAKVRLNTIRESMHQAEQDGKEEEMQLLLGIYNEMKKVEMELTKKLGTVILK